MRIRHKVPSIFSISMVDVLCCALGCVILLWLLNAKQTEDESEDQRRDSIALLAEAQAERDRRARADADATAARETLTAQMRELLAGRDEAVLVNRKLAEQLRLLTQSEAKLKVQLAGEVKLAKELEEKLKAGGIRIVSLEGDVKKASAALDAARKQGGEMSVKIVGLDEALKKLKGQLAVAVDARDKEKARAVDLAKSVTADKKELALLTELLKELRASKVQIEKALSTKESDLAALLKDKKVLEKLLAQRAAALKAAQGTVIKLEKDRDVLRAAAENRFAGIELVGKRVLILVDTSGSMEMTDENTTAPNKWKEVCATVGKLLRSLPDLEKYQVIGFGPELAWPVGRQGKWLDFDPKTSATQAEAAMRKVQPNGGTNMFIAMKAAFDFRKDGLDTIYLLSDGLPNQGEGVPADKRGAKGMERGVLLGKHVRTLLATTWNKPDARKRRVKIHTIGFFYESPDLGSFLWALARENDGSFVGMSRP